jgi:uncharacterized protein (TIGR03437 family)
LFEFYHTGCQDFLPVFAHSVAMRKTKRTEITVETFRRVVVRKPDGKASSDERPPSTEVRSRKERKTVKSPTQQILLVMTFCALGSWNAKAQTASSTMLQIEIANIVQYYDDATAFSSLATAPGVTPATPALNFRKWIQIGDIVAVNGQPVKGTLTANARQITETPTPTPGQAISDTTRNNLQDMAFEILAANGAPVGTIIAVGLGVGTAPPGAPLALTQGNNAIVGGTGAFLGARGILGQTVTSQTVAVRQASMTEDPANRIKNGGGRFFFVVQLIPMTRPEITTTTRVPDIFHADFSAVSAANPAVSGEVLTLRATGLGPTVPGVDPGQPFLEGAVNTVNSPLVVTVNAQAAQVVSAVGWPGLVDTYSVSFQVPDGTVSGTAAVQLSAAWIPGPAVNIPVQ